MSNVTPIKRTNKSLLMVERMILESIARGPKNVGEITVDTGLKIELISQIVSNLCSSSMIGYQKGRYQLAPQEVERFMKGYADSKERLEELKEIFVTLINSTYEGSGKIKLQKVALTKSERAILGSYFINLEAFIKSVGESRKREAVSEATKEQTVFIWGEANYLDLALESLSAI